MHKSIEHWEKNALDIAFYGEVDSLHKATPFASGPSVDVDNRWWFVDEVRIVDAGSEAHVHRSTVAFCRVRAEHADPSTTWTMRTLSEGAGQQGMRRVSMADEDATNGMGGDGASVVDARRNQPAFRIACVPAPGPFRCGFELAHQTTTHVVEGHARW